MSSTSAYVMDLGLDVAQRLPNVLDPGAPVAFQVFNAGANHGQRRPQLVTGIGRELALALQGRLRRCIEARIGTRARPA